MRTAIRPAAFALAVAIAVAACSTGATSAPSESASAAPSESAAPTPSESPSASASACSGVATVTPGALTIGTDNPAYPPYFQPPASGSPTKPWQLGDPTNGEGFESGFAYALAAKMGFPKDQVTWIVVPFDNSYAPGPKTFDLDINQISYTPARAKVVSFSVSYYDVNQAIVVKKGTKIAAVRSIAGLRPFKLGAQLGTTSYAFITTYIKPTQKPAVYPQNAGAVLALKIGQIDGLVVDLPTAFYVTAVQVPNSKILGQFEIKGKVTDHFGVVLAKGNPFTACVNRAITTLRTNGTLTRLQHLWLAKATGAPILK